MDLIEKRHQKVVEITREKKKNFNKTEKNQTFND